jgi:hypothetical protein
MLGKLAWRVNVFFVEKAQKRNYLSCGFVLSEFSCSLCFFVKPCENTEGSKIADSSKKTRRRARSLQIVAFKKPQSMPSGSAAPLGLWVTLYSFTLHQGFSRVLRGLLSLIYFCNLRWGFTFTFYLKRSFFSLKLLITLRWSTIASGSGTWWLTHCLLGVKQWKANAWLQIIVIARKRRSQRERAKQCCWEMIVRKDIFVGNTVWCTVIVNVVCVYADNHIPGQCITSVLYTQWR